MNPSELQSLESRMGITLPALYLDTMTAFPVAALAGNKDSYFWDNGLALIELNQLLRAGKVPGFGPWPAHMLAIGRAAGDDVVVAIDTKDPMLAVWSYAADVAIAPTLLEREFPSFVSKYIEFANDFLLPQRSRKGCFGFASGMLFLVIGTIIVLGHLVINGD